jgi:hypothetical protein
LEKEHAFDLREKKIEAYSRVTVEGVKAMFKQVFFETAGRLNIKLYSHDHYNSEARLSSVNANKDLYASLAVTQETIDDIKKFQQVHGLHPRL